MSVSYANGKKAKVSKNAISISGKIIRYLSAFMLAVVAIILSACGSAENLDGQAQKEWVYVPEFITFDGEDASYYDMKLVGDSIYYPVWERDGEGLKCCKEFYRYSLANGVLMQIPFQWMDGGDNKYIREFVPAEDGSIYFIVYEKNAASGLSDNDVGLWSLYRFDALGNQMFSKDLSDLMEESQSKAVSSIAMDARGRLYIGSGALVWLYDAGGGVSGQHICRKI